MDNGKIIDVEIMQRYCKPYDFDVWYEGHKQNCVANYEGSAPMMGVVGAKQIFERSITCRKVRYLKYYGDGVSKAYLEVKDTYKPDMVNKYECVGHYQKRLGTRLRKLKKTTNIKPLTDAVIDKLQNYFGMALRANTVQKMADAIWTSFLHVVSNGKHQYHSLCDKTWCQYR